MSLKQRINSTRPVGVYPLTFWHSVGIFELTEDYALAAFYNGSEYVSARRRQVYCTPSGRPFIRMRGIRFYLDEFTRT